MISLLKSVNDLEEVLALHGAAAKAFRKTIEASAQYAVELNPQDAAELRAHLTNLANDADKISAPQEYDALRSSFRGELREYRDKTQREVANLRSELKAAATAMQTFANGVTASGDEHLAQIKEEFSLLEEAGQSGDPERMRTGIGRATKTLRQSCEEMKRSNQMVVTQLQDEIRALHQEVEKERRAMYTDRSSGVWNRNKIDARLADLVGREHPFCVLAIGIRNLSDLQVKFSRTMIEESIKALLRRLDNLVGEDAMIGRWNEGVFVAILEVHPSIAEKLCEQAERKLNGDYSQQENGLSRTLGLEVAAELVERAKGDEGSSFYPRLGKATTAVEH